MNLFLLYGCILAILYQVGSLVLKNTIMQDKKPNFMANVITGLIILTVLHKSNVFDNME